METPRARGTPTPLESRPRLGFTIVQMRGLRVFLWLLTAQDPTSAEWDAALRRFEGLKRTSGGDPSCLRSLVVSDGGAPNALQRAQFHQTTGGAHRISVVTDVLVSPFKRSIVTALSWLNPGLRAFEPQHWAGALEHLHLDGLLAPMWHELQVLQARLAPSRTLRCIARECLRGPG